MDLERAIKEARKQNKTFDIPDKRSNAEIRQILEREGHEGVRVIKNDRDEKQLIIMPE